MPVKITLAGENTCQTNMRAQISYKRMSLSIPGQHPFQASQKEQRGH